MTRDKITVVEYVHGDADLPPAQRTLLENHPTGLRYRSLFGPDLDWQTIGFEGWLNQQQANNAFPFNV